MTMSVYLSDDIYYVCCMIEYASRKTKNERSVIAERLGECGIRRQLKYASINHTLSFDQVSDEWIEDYQIPSGSYDIAKECRNTVSSVAAIGRVYERLVESADDHASAERRIYEVFTSESFHEIEESLCPLE